MEKIGLFDLIDKFNSVAGGKNTFDKKAQSPSLKNGDNKASERLLDPKLPPPPHYVMNAKLLDFCLKHDAFSKTVDKNPK